VIVDAALAILREEGLDAVTMRRVATALDTGPASLYVYIRGRDELRTAMLNRVSDSVAYQEPDPARWREQVHTLVAQMLAAMEALPGIARVAVANVPTGESALRVADNLLGLLRAGGIRDQDAAWACDILPLIATAYAVETVTHQERAAANGPAEPEWVEHLASVFTSLPPERFPNLTALPDELTSGDGESRFVFAIDTFLDGLVARAARPAG
jgi:AcrR family transcriptional regulator